MNPAEEDSMAPTTETAAARIVEAAEAAAWAGRAVACKGWRWMPGMRSVAYRQAPLEPVVHRIGDLKSTLYPGSLPDLSDPATLGCLTALVREAYGNFRLTAIYCEPAHPGQSEGWAVQSADNRVPVAGRDYATEAEALVAALERAP